MPEVIPFPITLGVWQVNMVNEAIELRIIGDYYNMTIMLHDIIDLYQTVIFNCDPPCSPNR